MEQLKLFARREDDKHLCSGFICQFRCRCNSHVYLTETSRAAVETEFLSPYPYPWGCPYHGRVQGCRGDGISIPIPMRIPIPTAESRAAVGTEFLSPYPYPWGCPYPWQSPGLPWRRNLYPNTHVDPIPMADLETRRNFEEFIDGRFTVTVTVVNND